MPVNNQIATLNCIVQLYISVQLRRGHDFVVFFHRIHVLILLSLLLYFVSRPIKFPLVLIITLTGFL